MQCCFISHTWNKIKCGNTGCHTSLTDCFLSLWSVWNVRNMRKVLTLVKIKHGTPETWLNPWLVYISSLGWRNVELTGKNMDAHRGSVYSHLFCTTSSSDWCVRSDKLLLATFENTKKLSLACKITIFRAGSGAATLTLAKCLSHQVKLCTSCEKKIISHIARFSNYAFAFIFR